MRQSGALSLAFFLALLSCSAWAFSEDAQPRDYREKTQSLSQQMHGTLDELKAQQRILESSLDEARNDLKLSQEQVRRLLTECRDLNSSLASMSSRLSDYSQKLTVSEHSRKKWVTSSLIGWGIIIGYAVLKVLKLLGKLHVPFI